MSTAPTLHRIGADWYSAFVEAGGAPGRGVEWIVEQAETKAYQYVELGTAYDDFQPGNGTSYKLILHDLVRPQADLELRRHMSMHGNDLTACRCVDGKTVDVNYFRPIAESKGMSGRVGGELLVSLPETAGGRSAVLALHAGVLHTPDYIVERLSVRWGDAVPLAVYLSAFGDMVARLRDGVTP